MFEQQPVEEVWVSTSEAANITGYNQRYLNQLASRFWKQPEEERPIKILNRSNRYEFWLPDLIRYIIEIGHGPHPKRSPKE
jgi:hypothetical protein